MRGGKAGGGKDAITNLGDFACPSVVVAVVCSQDHLVQHRSSLLAIDPQQDLCLGHPRLVIKVVAMQGDTPITIRRAGKESVSKVLREHLLRIAPALRRPQARHRDGGETLVGQQALMGGRVIDRDACLVALFSVAGRAR